MASSPPDAPVPTDPRGFPRPATIPTPAQAGAAIGAAMVGVLLAVFVGDPVRKAGASVVKATAKPLVTFPVYGDEAKSAELPLNEAGLFGPTRASEAQPYAYTALNRETSRALALNSGLVHGAFGLFVAGLIGFSSLATGRGIPRALLGMVVGAVFGVLLPMAAGLAMGAQHYEIQRDPELAATPIGLGRSVASHLLVWGGVGLAAGLGYAVGAGGRWRMLVRSALGGVVGALIGTVLYEVAGMVAFGPHDDPTFLIPDPPKLLWTAWGFVAVGVGIGVMMSASAPPRKTAAPELEVAGR